jgi:pimeloyl-ACP methyl ester carboxylesterase
VSSYDDAMPQAKNGDTILEYDTFGDPDDPVLLLIMGFTAQMTAWDERFCSLLADQGFHVVRFDNRDCGLSSKTEGEPPDVMAMVTALLGDGEVPEVPYTMSDMAADAMSVVEAVGADRAHVVGASMGGMIAQVCAIEHPAKMLSLTSIMSTTGANDVGQPEPTAMQALLTPPPEEREAFIERGVEMSHIIGGPLTDDDRARERMGAAFDRSFYPQGAAFQMAAIVGTGDRTERLHGVTAPTLVIHGAVDPLVTPSGGEATAAAVPGARLHVYEQMGHDLPEPLWPEIVELIGSHARAAAG